MVFDCVQLVVVIVVVMVVVVVVVVVLHVHFGVGRFIFMVFGSPQIVEDTVIELSLSRPVIVCIGDIPLTYTVLSLFFLFLFSCLFLFVSGQAILILASLNDNVHGRNSCSHKPLKDRIVWCLFLMVSNDVVCHPLTLEQYNGGLVFEI